MTICIRPLLIILFTCLLAHAFSQNLDINLLKSINKTETRFKNNYLKLNADAVIPLGIGLPAAIAITGFAKHDKQLQRDALYMSASFLLNAGVTLATKKIVNRQRPFAAYSFIIKRADTEERLSFPSGHTSTAFCTATDVALRYRKWYFVAPSYLFATSVAWARMYQGVHYPSDVFTGAIVGAGSAWLCYKAQTKWFIKNPGKTITPKF